MLNVAALRNERRRRGGRAGSGRHSKQRRVPLRREEDYIVAIPRAGRTERGLAERDHLTAARVNFLQFVVCEKRDEPGVR
jgi:hypothetical protein